MDKVLDNPKEFFDSLTTEEFDNILNQFGFKYVKIEEKICECESCQGDNNIIFKDQNDKWILSLETGHWDTYYDGFDCAEVEIDFCPWCGRKL